MKAQLLALLLCMVFSSCAFYRQNVVNVPLFERKGQLRLGAHKSFTGTEAQAGYALTNHVGIVANYNNRGPRKTEHSSVNYTIEKHRFAEAGLGVYKKGTARSEESVREVFLLAGKGFTSEFVQGLDSSRSIFRHLREASYTRLCLQADLGTSSSKKALAFSPRLLYIYYYGVTDNRWPDFRAFTASYICAEAAATGRYNLGRHLSLSGQVTMSVPVVGFAEHKYGYFNNFSPFNFSAGLVLNLELLKPNTPTPPE